MIRMLAAILVVQLVFPVSIFAEGWQKAIVVVPVHDGVSDKFSDELADSFSKALAEEKLDVISKDKVESVMEYYQPSRVDAEGLTINDAESALFLAKEHYYNFDYPEAAAQIQRAMSILETHPEEIFGHGLLFRDTYVSAGIIEKSEKGRDDFARSYFRRALEIDPHYELDEKSFAPSTVALFSEVRAEVSNKPVGSISIESDPKVAEVYINGILKGVTPAMVSGLPSGTYSLAIRANKYKPIEKSVAVSAGETAKIWEKLNWIYSSNEKVAVSKPANDARDQIAEGVRIAELMRVPKVVLIDADDVADGGGDITLRMVDRKYRAGHNPIVIRYSKEKPTFAQDLAEAADILVRQSDVAILLNPKKNIDPDGIGDPILLGRRGKELWTAPTFWAVVGGALAATAGGVAAAVAMSGNGNEPTTGSVNVQFK